MTALLVPKACFCDTFVISGSLFAGQGDCRSALASFWALRALNTVGTIFDWKSTNSNVNYNNESKNICPSLTLLHLSYFHGRTSLQVLWFQVNTGGGHTLSPLKGCPPSPAQWGEKTAKRRGQNHPNVAIVSHNDRMVG